MSEHHEPRCAREGCHQLVYTGNALCLQSAIGPLIVYVCAEHFAEYLQRSVVPQTLMDKLKETKA